uniref:L-lactate dehydrogenase complex protein LldG n=1 Tax=Candidatus Kentrum sp. DK TaxID=2126562 RepID=A0A450STD5_9GAMM|nr:MAG: L-lactate dehydrogenase complex protein LldG [Candidatus Kentron sp. DK]
MNEARLAILSRLRSATEACGVTDAEPCPSSAFPGSPAPPEPVRPFLPEGDPGEYFIAKLTAVAAEATRVPGLAQVPDALIRYLERHNLPRRLVASRDPILDRIPWPDALTLRHGIAVDEDQVAITGAFAAVAETGSLVLCASEQTPATLNFLPENHIVVLETGRIVPYLEDVWQRIPVAFPTWPRAIHFVTGPSRTADIEQTMQLGAHGPRRLMVMLVD